MRQIKTATDDELKEMYETRVGEVQKLEKYNYNNMHVEIMRKIQKRLRQIEAEFAKRAERRIST